MWHSLPLFPILFALFRPARHANAKRKFMRKRFLAKRQSYTQVLENFSTPIDMWFDVTPLWEGGKWQNTLRATIRLLPCRGMIVLAFLDTLLLPILWLSRRWVWLVLEPCRSSRGRNCFFSIFRRQAPFLWAFADPFNRIWRNKWFRTRRSSFRQGWTPFQEKKMSNDVIGLELYFLITFRALRSAHNKYRRPKIKFEQGEEKARRDVVKNAGFGDAAGYQRDIFRERQNMFDLSAF